MAAQRLRMKQLRHILRLRHEIRPHRKISGSIGLGTVSEFLNRAQGAGLSWPSLMTWTTQRSRPASTRARPPLTRRGPRWISRSFTMSSSAPGSPCCFACGVHLKAARTAMPKPPLWMVSGCGTHSPIARVSYELTAWRA